MRGSTITSLAAISELWISRSKDCNALSSSYFEWMVSTRSIAELKRQRQASCLQKVYWPLSSPGLLTQLDACELVNRIPQLHRIVLDGPNDAGKNQREVNLR